MVTYNACTSWYCCCCRSGAHLKPQQVRECLASDGDAQHTCLGHSGNVKQVIDKQREYHTIPEKWDCSSELMVTTIMDCRWTELLCCSEPVNINYLLRKTKLDKAVNNTHINIKRSNTWKTKNLLYFFLLLCFTFILCCRKKRSHVYGDFHVLVKLNQ